MDYANPMTYSHDGRRGRFCRWFAAGFAVLYAIAISLFAIGTYGLFGSERDPLAGVFLIPMVVPRVYLLDFAFLPESARPWLGMLAPLLNLALIVPVCRQFRR